MNSAQHSSKSNEHYTPHEVIQAAQATMGGIDLDPASCETANSVVRAAQYFGKEQDGLSVPWYGTVFLNPPGSKIRGKSAAAVWWSKLVSEWQIGNVSEAIFVGFSIEILQTTQRAGGPVPLDFPFCVPAARLDFLGEDLKEQGSPTHANVIVYLPPKASVAAGITRFRREFAHMGRGVVPT